MSKKIQILTVVIITMVVTLFGTILLINKPVSKQNFQPSNSVQNKKNIDFENKSKCEKYAENINKDLNDSSTESNYRIYRSLENIFYSNIENSCLYSTLSHLDGEPKYYFIEDVLTKQLVKRFSFKDEKFAYLEFLKQRGVDIE